MGGKRETPRFYIELSRDFVHFVASTSVFVLLSNIIDLPFFFHLTYVVDGFQRYRPACGH